jgi:pimeloyl-ACP methyl ester carboxylesterase
LVDYVADLLDVADALGWEHFGLLGHSLGAGIASVFAGTFPARVTELFLIDGIGPISCNPDGVPAQLQEALLRHRERSRRECRVFPDLATAVQARQRTGALGRESAECLVKRAVMQVDGGYSWRHDHRLILPSRLYMTEEQVLAFLRSITAPTLLVRSSNGLINRFKPNQRISSISGISVVELTGGHHLHMDNPFTVVREIERFHKALLKNKKHRRHKSEKSTL